MSEDQLTDALSHILDCCCDLQEAKAEAKAQQAAAATTTVPILNLSVLGTEDPDDDSEGDLFDPAFCEPERVLDVKNFEVSGCVRCLSA